MPALPGGVHDPRRAPAGRGLRDRRVHGRRVPVREPGARAGLRRLPVLLRRPRPRGVRGGRGRSVRRAGAPFFLLLHTTPRTIRTARRTRGPCASAAPPACRVSHDRPHVPAARGLGRRGCRARARRPAGVRLRVAASTGRRVRRTPASAPSGPTRVLPPALHRWIDGGYLVRRPGTHGRSSERLRGTYRRGLAPTDAILSRTFAALEAAQAPARHDRDRDVRPRRGPRRARLPHPRAPPARGDRPRAAPGAGPGPAARGRGRPRRLRARRPHPDPPRARGLPPAVEELDGRSLVALAHGREGGHPVVSTADRYEWAGGLSRVVREITVRDDRSIVVLRLRPRPGDVVSEHAFDLVEDPESLDPRPVGVRSGATPSSAAWWSTAATSGRIVRVRCPRSRRARRSADGGSRSTAGREEPHRGSVVPGPLVSRVRDRRREGARHVKRWAMSVLAHVARRRARLRIVGLGASTASPRRALCWPSWTAPSPSR